MILRTRGGNVAYRDANYDAFVPPVPPPGVLPVTSGNAASLPVVISAGRLISESIAGMCLDVYREDPATEMRAEATDTWQYDLIERPNLRGLTRFGWVEHMVWSLLFYGNALAIKTKAAGQVIELVPLNPESFTVQRNPSTGEIEYVVRTRGASWQKLPADSILHVTGKTTDDAMIGKGLIEIAAQTMRRHLHLETYQRKFFENDATPGGVISVPGRLQSQQRTDLSEAWKSRHQGPANAGQIAVLDNGASYQSIGISPRDVQLVELARFTVQETARIFTLPLSFLADTEQPPPTDLEGEDSRLLRHGLLPWINRIEAALNNDPDLVPLGSTLEIEFDVDDLVRAPMSERYGAYSLGRQGGWLSINDIREQEDMPPITGGDVYLETPVGGAPNLQPTTTPTGESA